MSAFRADTVPAMNVPVLVLGLVSLAAAIALVVFGRRRRLTRGATTGAPRTSALDILGIALAVAGCASLARAF